MKSSDSIANEILILKYFNTVCLLVKYSLLAACQSHYSNKL